MNHVDQFGVVQRANDAAAVRGYDAAVAKLLTLNNDPLLEAEKSLAIDPGFVMGHVLKGLLCALSTDKLLLADAKSALAAAKAARAGHAAASPRESRHLAALEAFTLGGFHRAVTHWEEILIDEPRDALAMFAAHQADFYLGQSRELRDRVARRLTAIDSGSPLTGYYRGMHAFGLEEMGEYERAEREGRAAVAADPRDAWAIHAVAHVHEMTNRVEDGERWLSERSADWATNNFFAVHNWWHLALYLVDQQRCSEVLALYDSRIRAADSTNMLDLLDASALLWRLMLQGIDAGERWRRLASAWEAHAEDAWYAFNDLHAMMAFTGAARQDLGRRLLAAMRVSAQSDGDNGMVTRTVGLPVAAALFAYGETRYGEAFELLAPVLPLAIRTGGSHAQRDVLAQTLAAAAEKSGRVNAARELLEQRLQLKPRSALNRAWRARLGF